MGMSLILDGSNSVTINSGAVLGITSGTSVASTSGTSIDFTGLPAWVKRLTVMFSGVSTTSTSLIQFQLGTSSGFVSAGYLGAYTVASSAVASSNLGTGFLFAGSVATHVRHGQMVFTLLSSNTYVGCGFLGFSDIAQTAYCNGSIALGGTLDRIRLTTANGTDTFDAGTINILYE
jgi:hypothetical protein